MRIQHNIMAMSAYRNYTNNVSAMKKNLEKLSSGYKINRAGDDAAGLAISEKMRAQITGLETAQKNAKDGISLVQTAEGALTEVHDMLNRMVELASMSANGTYDNTTDRAQLQKEMDQLTSEINRIADSANFNGIKLLDGSMDGSPIAGAITSITAKLSDATISQLLPEGTVLGVNTVKHSGSADAKTAQFGISLHNVTYSNDDANGSMTIQFGGDQIRISGGGSAAVLDTGDIATTLGTTNPREMTVGTQAYNVTGETLSEQLTSWVTQFNADTAANSNNAVRAEVKGSTIEFTAAATGIAGNALSVGGINLAGGVDGAKAVNKGTFALDKAFANGDTFTLDGTDYKVYTDQATADADAAFTGTKLLLTDADFTNQAAQEKWIGKKLVESGIFENADYDSPVQAAGSENEFTMTAVENGKVATSDVAAMKTAFDTAIGNKLTITAGGPALTFTYAADGAATEAGVGKDDVAATYNTGAMTRLNPTLEIAGYSMTPTKTDPTEMLQEFIDDYNAHNSAYRAEWNENNNGIKFTATSNGERLGGGDDVEMGTDNAANFQFKAEGADGGASDLGREGTLNAEQILNAIMSGKAEINTGAGFRTLSQADINGSITLSDGAKYKISAEGDTLTFTQLENDVDTDGAFNPAVLDRQVTITSTVNANTGKNMHAGDYQKSTTFNTPSDDVAANRLASTAFTTDGSKIKDKASIFIGGKNYQFTVDEEAAKKDATKVYIGDLVDEEGKINPADTATMTKINERITVAAKDNEVYTVGYDTTRLTFTEKVGYTTGSQEYDLTKLSEIERSLGYAEADTPNDKGKGLTLQIGDTAEDFNRLVVNIKDMHAESLGLGNVKISDQASAATAIDKIKAAINTVSDVRGTLGATQNRLDHTINNLSVMTENIQDAESTIRDVDVAEEMMAYTKNNILIQSAQAMLAQANQVPQGVLQLLQ